MLGNGASIGKPMVNGQSTHITILAGSAYQRQTNTTVPQPEQLSHRIQVARWDRYLGVSKKFDTVPHQDAVPIPLHSYSYGIGLSFLSLPCHVHRIIGDISALPKPSPIDVEEPVDLIIITYGAVLFGVGYHG
jgi:hypothetical protein